MEDSNRTKKSEYNKNVLSVYVHENIRLRAIENAAKHDMTMSEYIRWLILLDSLNNLSREVRANGKKNG